MNTDTRATRMSENWVPKEDTVEAMRRECPAVNQPGMLPKFRDYYLGQTGAKGLSTDWDALYRNSVRWYADKIAEKQPPAARAIHTAKPRDIDHAAADRARAIEVPKIKQRLHLKDAPTASTVAPTGSLPEECEAKNRPAEARQAALLADAELEIARATAGGAR